MRPRATTLLLAALLAPAAHAQLEDHTHVPMDPGAICDALRESYAQSPVEERIIISVTRNSVTRSEPITMRLWPAPKGHAPTLELLLGPLTAWTTADTLYAIHRDNASVYFAQPIGKGGVLDALETAMPPIPAPDLFLALAAGPGCPTDLPYAPAIQWTDATVNAEAHPAQAHLIGESEADADDKPDPANGARGAHVELIADLEPPLLRWFVIENKDQDLRIEGEVRRSPAPDAFTPIDIANRRRVATLAELAPAGNTLRIGDVLQPIMVNPAGPASPGVAAPLKPLRGPAVVVFFTEWTRDVPVALAAAQEAVKGFPEYTLCPVAVLDLSQGPPDARSRIDALEPKVDPLPLYYTTAPDRTIQRVDPDAKAALLVLDAGQIIRMSEPLDRLAMLGDPSGLTARIVGAITSH